MPPESGPPVALLVAVRNEAGLVGRFLDEVLQVFRDAGLLGRVRVVVVDDASVDGTPEAIRAWTDRRPGLEVETLRLESNRGNQSAMA